MNDFTKIWLVMISITAMFFLTQVIVNHINPGHAPQFTQNNDQLGNPNDLNNQPSNPNQDLPSQSSINTDNSGNIFSDPLTVVWNWIMGIPGAKYISTMIDTPAHIFQMMGIPLDLSRAIVLLWGALVIVITVMMITWRG